MKKSLVSFCLMLVVFSVTANFCWQIYQKPSEIVALLSWSKPKTHESTWAHYSKEFRKYSTKLITPSFLAALAQVESAGNPLATPDWKFRFTDRLSQIFSPQSSSVGLYQFTSATFDKAKKYCVQNGSVTKVNCTMSSFYTRLFPSHSIEVASAYLDVEVRKLMQRFKKNLSLQKAQKLAGVIHLCGPKRAEAYLRSGFNPRLLGRCGSHSAKHYLQRVERSQRQFKKLTQAHFASK